MAFQAGRMGVARHHGHEYERDAEFRQKGDEQPHPSGYGDYVIHREMGDGVPQGNKRQSNPVLIQTPFLREGGYCATWHICR
jgi:hypothetical protein